MGELAHLCREERAPFALLRRGLALVPHEVVGNEHLAPFGGTIVVPTRPSLPCAWCGEEGPPGIEGANRQGVDRFCEPRLAELAELGWR